MQGYNYQGRSKMSSVIACISMHENNCPCLLLQRGIDLHDILHCPDLSKLEADDGNHLQKNLDR